MTQTSERNCYVFVNSRTGNVIGYHTLSAKLDQKKQQRSLDNKKEEIAVANGLRIDSVYWKLQDNS